MSNAKSNKPELVLWGRKPGGPWLKLDDNTSQAERARRRADGWEVLVLHKGDRPNERHRPVSDFGDWLTDDTPGRYKPPA